MLIAGLRLLFTGRYPRGLFDFVLGLDRWVFRVVAYAGLMTDRYPPFRLDMGGSDGVPAVAEPEATAAGGCSEVPEVDGREWSLSSSGASLRSWRSGCFAAGVVTAVVDQTQRDTTAS